MDGQRVLIFLAALFAAASVIDATVLPFEEQFLPAGYSPHVPSVNSSHGTKFLLGFMQNILPRDPALSVPDAYFIVVTKEHGVVEFDVVTMFGGVEVRKSYEVTSNRSVRINFPADDVYVTTDVQRDRAIWVQTKMGKKISIFVINDEPFSTDGYLALPCDGMIAGEDFRRYEYVILSTNQAVTGQQGSRVRASQFLLITCEDDTNVNVRPSSSITGPGVFSSTQFGPGLSNAAADWQISNSDNLPGKQTLLVAKNGVDFTGTIIKSNKPLVVISGHQCGQVPQDVTACDHLVVQIPPSPTWGNTFLLNPLDGRRTGDFYRFATNRDDTEITITCVDDGGSRYMIDYQSTLDREVGMNWGQFETHPDPCRVSIPFVSKFCCLQSSKPIILAQYSYGHEADQDCGKLPGDLGDPFMSIIPPAIQYKNTYHLVPINASAGDFTVKRVGVSVYVTYFQPECIILDFDPLESDPAEWQPIYCSEGDVCGYGITKELDDEEHILFHSVNNSALFVHSYGFRVENSYALSGGMELQPVAGTTVSCAEPPECVEEGTTVTIVCTRELDLTSQSRVMIETSDRTATAPDDYNAISNLVLNYRGGNNPARQEAEMTFDVVIVADGVEEPPEDLVIYINPVRTVVVLTPWITLKICGIGGATVYFDPTDYNVTEGVDDFANLMLVRSGDLSRETVVTVTTAPGSAIAGSDFESTVVTVTFQPAQTTATIQVPIVDDANIESTERFTASLTSTDPSVAIVNDTATIDINDIDVPMPKFEETMYIVPENNRTVPLCIDVGVKVSDPLDLTITAKNKDPPDAQEADFFQSTNVIVEPPNSRVCTDFMDLVVDDSIALEGNQSFTICVGNSSAWVTIIDDDVPIIESDDIIINEDGGSATVTVNLLNEIENDFSLEYNTETMPDGAEEGNDFTGESGNIIFVPDGPKSHEIDIPINDDQETESDELLMVSFSSEDLPSDMQIDTMVTIIDNDIVVGFDPTSYTVTEGTDPSVTLTVFRTGNEDLPATVNFATVPGTADDSDFTPTFETVEFAPGETEKTVVVPITDDFTLEDLENFSATLTSQLPNVIVSDNSSNADITIIDDDRVTIGFVEILYAVKEDDGSAVVTVTVLSGQLSQDVVINFDTQDGSATSPDDYMSTSLQLTFGPGRTTQNISIPITDDNVYEPNTEEFVAGLVLVTPGVDVQVIPSEATIKIADNDEPKPMFEFSMYTVPEGDPGSVPLCVNISVEITQPITYSITTGHKSPTEAEDSDFTAGTTITIQPPGPVSCIDFTDLIVNDELGLEGDESFSIFIAGTDSMAMVTIIDDDVVSVGFDPTSYTVLEGGSTDLIIVKNGDTEGPLLVTVSTNDGTATGGEDYDVLDGVQVVFPPGVFSQTVTLNTLPEVPVEGDEDIQAVLTPVDNRVDVFEPIADVTIVEDVVPTISFTTDSTVVGEGDGAAEVCLKLSAPLSTDLEVVVTSTTGTADSGDFVPETLTASFAAGATEACVEFIVTDDLIALEGNETFTVTFDPPAGILPGTPSTATVTIIDNDVPIISSPDVTVPESVGDAQVCVTLSTPIQASFEVSYTTSDGTALVSGPDYEEVKGKLEFTPSGGNRACVRIPIVDDEIMEPREVFTVTFTPDVPGTESSTTATVRITDNDQIGTIVNDTVLGDPLFTVTLPEGDEFMCYEVHGEAGKYFNLISDTCTSVNALYTALPDEDRINTIKEIGIYARDTSNACVQIKMSYSGCTASVNGQTITSNYRQNGTSVRPYLDRWRVSVPNCGPTQAVMWIYCQPPPDMLKFRIARGNNLSPTSHGLLAQFWNIPITIFTEAGEVFVDLFDPAEDGYRRIPAEVEPRTWDQTQAPCFYVGNSQGGPLQFSGPDQSVIEGSITDYEMGSLFSTSFSFSQFDETQCAA